MRTTYLNQDDSRPKTKRRVFVKFSYVDAIGFYAIGLMHILGNTTRALTATVARVHRRAGMFANFPGLVGVLTPQGGRNTSGYPRTLAA